MKTTAIVIPARLDSSRFPNKMLADLNGKPLIKHVFDKCSETGLPTYVVTPDKEIANVIGKEYSLLVGEADNGTERCALALNYINYEHIINVQGDMPDINSDIIFSVNNVLEEYGVATAYTDMKEVDRKDSNTVKLIHNGKKAHWFCRASLEYGDWHLGVYGYRRSLLDGYSHMTKHTEEAKEKLEQLRWIQNGYDIGVAKVDFNGTEINTQEDLEKWRKQV